MSMPADAFEPQTVHVLSDLAQVKVLANPLRMRILEALCREELTTKQVAERLEEKPTKLYHHVEALERVGLIQLTRTQQNRGTLEKYYRAIAQAFRADATLFGAGALVGEDPSDGSGGAPEALPGMIGMVLDRTGQELAELTGGGSPAELESSGLLTFCEVVASQEAIDRLRDRLTEVIEEITEDDDSSASDPDPNEDRRYRLTLAFFPLDRGRPAPPDRD